MLRATFFRVTAKPNPQRFPRPPWYVYVWAFIAAVAESLPYVFASSEKRRAYAERMHRERLELERALEAKMNNTPYDHVT